MKRTYALGGAVGAVLAIASVTIATASSFSGRDTSHPDAAGSVEVLHLVGKEVSEAYLDLGDPDYSVGDQFPFRNDLFRRDTKVGEDGGFCVVTDISGEASTVKCVGSNSFPAGQITVQGLVTYGPGEDIKTEPYFFAITGGTGKYRAARGEVKIEEVTAKEFKLTFRIVR